MKKILAIFMLIATLAIFTAPAMADTQDITVVYLDTEKNILKIEDTKADFNSTDDQIRLTASSNYGMVSGELYVWIGAIDKNASEQEVKDWVNKQYLYGDSDDASYIDSADCKEKYEGTSYAKTATIETFGAVNASDFANKKVVITVAAITLGSIEPETPNVPDKPETPEKTNTVPVMLKIYADKIDTIPAKDLIKEVTINGKTIDVKYEGKAWDPSYQGGDTSYQAIALIEDVIEQSTKFVFTAEAIKGYECETKPYSPGKIENGKFILDNKPFYSPNAERNVIFIKLVKTEATDPVEPETPVVPEETKYKTQLSFDIVCEDADFNGDIADIVEELKVDEETFTLGATQNNIATSATKTIGWNEFSKKGKIYVKLAPGYEVKSGDTHASPYAANLTFLNGNPAEDTFILHDVERTKITVKIQKSVSENNAKLTIRISPHAYQYHFDVSKAIKVLKINGEKVNTTYIDKDKSEFVAKEVEINQDFTFDFTTAEGYKIVDFYRTTAKNPDADKTDPDYIPQTDQLGRDKDGNDILDINFTTDKERTHGTYTASTPRDVTYYIEVLPTNDSPLKKLQEELCTTAQLTDAEKVGKTAESITAAEDEIVKICAEIYAIQNIEELKKFDVETRRRDAVNLLVADENADKSEVQVVAQSLPTTFPFPVNKAEATYSFKIDGKDLVKSETTSNGIITYAPITLINGTKHTLEFKCGTGAKIDKAKVSTLNGLMNDLADVSGKHDIKTEFTVIKDEDGECKIKIFTTKDADFVREPEQPEVNPDKPEVDPDKPDSNHEHSDNNGSGGGCNAGLGGLFLLSLAPVVLRKRRK